MMKSAPLLHELQSAPRKVVIHRLQRVDGDPRHMFSIFGVEVGRVVVIEIHPDDNSVEGADPGHAFTVAVAYDKNPWNQFVLCGR